MSNFLCLACLAALLPCFLAVLLPYFLTSLIKDPDGCTRGVQVPPYGNQCSVTRIERPLWTSSVTTPISSKSSRVRYLVIRPIPNSANSPLGRSTVLLRCWRHRE